MITKIYETERLYVRPLTKEDVLSEHYREWFFDQEVTRYNSHGLFPYTKQQMEEFISRIESGSEIIWAVIIKKKKISEIFDPASPCIPVYEHIGNITLQRIDDINRTAEFACVFGAKEYWGQGYGTESARLLFDHGFNKLNLNRIWTGTAISNIGMKKIAEKLGMKEEGVFRDAVFLEGEYVDVIEYGLLRSEWKLPSAKYEDKMIHRNGCTEDIPRGVLSDQKERRMAIINKISEIRTKNNKGWMSMLTVLFKYAPKEASKIMKGITAHDKEITKLAETLSKI
ncbi:MAG TPA: GNAT family N-acetyltransferase [bacterium]|nr:GNAT family N-acetyltransferase [bacterium]